VGDGQDRGRSSWFTGTDGDIRRSHNRDIDRILPVQKSWTAIPMNNQDGYVAPEHTLPMEYAVEVTLFVLAVAIVLWILSKRPY
jgi:hypothetical protein